MTTSTALSCTFEWNRENKLVEMEVSYIYNSKEPMVFGRGVMWIGIEFSDTNH